ncbi:MAG: alpha/beta fold hydrolase [Candidatus Eremiobacterota bacterium]
MRVTALLVALWLGLLAPAAADEFPSNGVKIHYVDMGEGEPVVLIHGAYGSVATNWVAPGTAGELARTYRVVALDCRGHGRSDKPRSGYGVEMAQDVVRLMDHLGIPKARVVGYSMGGMIALKFTVLHPERVERLVLGGMGMLEQGTPLQRFWKALRPRRSAVPVACLQGFSQLAVTREEVQGLNMPVSVIVGEKDPCRELYVDKLVSVRPSTPVTVIPEAGHITCLVKPKFRSALVADLAVP